MLEENQTGDEEEKRCQEKEEENCRLFNAKSILLEEQMWYYLIHSWEERGSYLSQEYLPESECNSATHLLRFRSPSL